VGLRCVSPVPDDHLRFLSAELPSSHPNRHCHNGACCVHLLTVCFALALPPPTSYSYHALDSAPHTESRWGRVSSQAACVICDVVMLVHGMAHTGAASLCSIGGSLLHETIRMSSVWTRPEALGILSWAYLGSPRMQTILSFRAIVKGNVGCWVSNLYRRFIVQPPCVLAIYFAVLQVPPCASNSRRPSLSAHPDSSKSFVAA
jgi:hypothetical protein